jgi:hypothetical protein
VAANPLKEKRILVGYVHGEERRMDDQSSRRAATAAQQFCSIGGVESLTGGDGISKTMMWKKYAALRNFAHARTFPVRHAGANRRLGFHP